MPSTKPTILVTGANGLVASALLPALIAAGTGRVLALTSDRVRCEENNVDLLAHGLKVVTLDEPPGAVDCVVHLAGEPVASKMLTAARFAAISASRVAYLHRLQEYLRDSGVRYFIQASSTDIYADSSAPVTELDNLDDSELAKICISQEFTARDLFEGQHTTVAVARLGIVLSRHAILVRALQNFLPIRIIGFHNYLPYVALHDVVQALMFLLEREAGGIFNLASPDYLTFDELTGCINHRTICGLRLPLPAFLFRLGDRRMQMLLTHKQVVPRHLSELGFAFSIDTRDKLRDYLRDDPAR